MEFSGELKLPVNKKLKKFFFRFHLDGLDSSCIMGRMTTKKKIDMGYFYEDGPSVPMVWVERCGDDRQGVRNFFRMACMVNGVEYVHWHIGTDWQDMHTFAKVVSNVGTIDPDKWFPRDMRWSVDYRD